MKITGQQLKNALVYAYETLIQKKHYPESKTDAQPNTVDRTQPLHKIVIQRDYYYRRYVRWEDCFRYLFVILFVQICTIVTTLLITRGSLAYFQLLNTYVFIEMVVSLVISTVLPILLLRVYFSKLVPRMYSLADDDSEWLNKSMALILPGELIRFILGLLPISLLNLGTVTSPVTNYIYSAIYRMVYFENDTLYIAATATPYNSLLSTVIYLVIYITYFTLHLYTVLYMINGRHRSNKHRLLGNLTEYNKHQQFI